MAPIRIGMVGCGYWGPNLLRNLAALDEEKARVRVVADASKERRAFVSKTYPNIATIESAEAVFRDPEIDAVVIATPAATHAALTKQALEAGKDVFVEKPLALTTGEAVDLTRTAEKGGRTLMVGHTFLFNGAVRDLKRRIDAGELGRVYYLYSQRLNLGIVRSDVNAAWNLAPHDISIGCWLLGKRPIRVSANGVHALQPESGNLADVVFLNIAFEGGVNMHVHVSWLDPHKVRTMTVVGDRRMVVYDDVSEDKIRIYDKGITRADPVPMEQPSDFARFKMVTRAGDLTIPNIRVPEPLFEEVKHFVECVRERRRPLSDGWSGVVVTATLEAADRSLRAGGAPVEINLPEHG